jgi:hypothetical protein
MDKDYADGAAVYVQLSIHPLKFETHMWRGVVETQVVKDVMVNCIRVARRWVAEVFFVP